MKRSLLLLLFLGSLASAREKLSLNLVVDDRSEGIEETLLSAKPLIDYWVIVDSSSDANSDGNAEKAIQLLSPIPGKLHKSGSTNKSENHMTACSLAREGADFALLLDPGMRLEFDYNFAALDQDLYFIRSGSELDPKPRLIKLSLPWHWQGDEDPYLICDQDVKSGELEAIRLVSQALALEKQKRGDYIERLALADCDVRSGHLDRAKLGYLELSSFSQAAEDQYVAFMRLGKLMSQEKAILDKPDSEISEADLIESIDFYERASKLLPDRAEPIYYITTIYNHMGRHQQALDILKAASVRASSESDWYAHWGLDYQLSFALYYLERYKEAIEACQRILAYKDLPADLAKQVEENQLVATQMSNNQIVAKSPGESRLFVPLRNVKCTVDYETYRERRE